MVITWIAKDSVFLYQDGMLWINVVANVETIKILKLANAVFHVFCSVFDVKEHTESIVSRDFFGFNHSV
jgi:hypothetical protein